MTIDRLREEAVLFVRRIGTCARCMRESLFFMLTSLGVFAVALGLASVTGLPSIAVVAGALAAVATGLFALHIVTAGLNGARQALRKSQTQPVAEAGAPVQPLISRRTVFAKVARAAGIASMSAIAVAAAPSTAKAAWCLYIGTECPYGYNCCADKRYNPPLPYCCPSNSYCQSYHGNCTY